ncbi:MAG: hypothetical protein H0U78_05050 [Rickettsiaceae bacterium]|nr:hypothetical protein [Rickettsiaceae bacterium]
MYGKLKIKGKDADISSLTIFDIINHLKDLSSVGFTNAEETGKDYMDVLCSVYRLAAKEMGPEDTHILACLDIFRKSLIRLVNDGASTSKLFELGIKGSDIALLSNSPFNVRELAKSCGDKNPYELAKELRFMQIAKDTYGDDFVGNNITVSHLGHEIPLDELIENKLYTKKAKDKVETAILLVEGDGETAWDYNNSAYDYAKLSKCFDMSMVLGSSSHDIDMSSVGERFSVGTYAADVRKLNLDLLVIKFNLHDSKEFATLGRAVKMFPDDLAKETVYIIDTCYSGQYHVGWEKDAWLISTSSASQPAYGGHCRKMADFEKYCGSGAVTLESILKFYSTYTMSEPQVSRGATAYTNTICAMPIKTLTDLIFKLQEAVPDPSLVVTFDIDGVGSTFQPLSFSPLDKDLNVDLLSIGRFGSISFKAGTIIKFNDSAHPLCDLIGSALIDTID